MKFSFILWVLGRKFAAKSKGDQDFISYIKEKDCTIQIKTADGKKGRAYKFQDGTALSLKGTSGPADMSLVWSSAAAGAKAMTSKDPNASMEALKDGTLKIEGDGNLALWFAGAVKKAMS